MDILDASAEVRGSFSPAQKLGLGHDGSAFEQVSIVLDIKTEAPADHVSRLVAHAEMGCHAEQSLRALVPVRLLARLNGDEIGVGPLHVG